jgi:hypothetical protein
MGFVLLLLIKLKIIPHINVSTFSPNDMEYVLPELSNGAYSNKGLFVI